MSERKEKKHKKKKHKKDKKPRLHERVGYTDDDNPFGDRDLGATFVWKKKEDQSRKKKRPPPSRDEELELEPPARSHARTRSPSQRSTSGSTTDRGQCGCDTAEP